MLFLGMFSSRIISAACLLLWICVSQTEGTGYSATEAEWAEFKATFGKNYTNSEVSESTARYYYNYNMANIVSHNTRAARGQFNYTLSANQFTDMRVIQFNALFPTITWPSISFESPPPPLQIAPPAFNPITDIGLNISVEDQGIGCNSGWAYAAAKAIEILQASQLGNLNPERLSAQNLIDCAGAGEGCTASNPQNALDYLTKYGEELYEEREYKNRKDDKKQGMCVPKSGEAKKGSKVSKYCKIKDDDDEQMKQVVGAGYPVIIEFNPTSLNFMSYADGIYEQPSSGVSQGAHFLVVIGYGREKDTDYWECVNSFGKKWGKKGRIKIKRDPKKPICKKAIYPSELA